MYIKSWYHERLKNKHTPTKISNFSKHKKISEFWKCHETKKKHLSEDHVSDKKASKHTCSSRYPFIQIPIYCSVKRGNILNKAYIWPHWWPSIVFLLFSRVFVSLTHPSFPFYLSYSNIMLIWACNIFFNKCRQQKRI